jgi:hypothetical protein
MRTLVVAVVVAACGGSVPKETIDAAPPDATSSPDAARPADGASVPDGALPDATSPDGAIPDAARPDAELPDGAIPDAMAADGPLPSCVLTESTALPDLWASLCADRTSYAAGDTIVLTFTVENHGATDEVLTTQPNCNPDQVYDVTVSRRAGTVFHSLNHCYGGAPQSVTIPAGGSWSASVMWDQHEDNYVPANEGPQVEPGVFTATGALLTSPAGEVSATTSFTITGPAPSCPAPSLHDPVSFRDATYCLGGPSPWDVVAIDVNHDLNPDLVVADFGASTLDVYLGNGDGTFQPPTQVTVFSSPTSLAAGDFDENGDVDFAVGYEDQTVQSRTDVSVVFGNGDGTFQAPISLTAGQWPVKVAVADFDGDGHDDVAAAESLTSEVSVFRGNGDGTFMPAPAHLSAVEPWGMVAARLDGDAHPDLAVVNASGVVSVFFSHTDGTWSSPGTTYTMADTNAYALAAGDLDCDGANDLVVSQIGGDGGFDVLHNDGTGVFTFDEHQPLRGGAEGLAIADFDGDGILDLATANYTDAYTAQAIAVLPGNGDDSFADPFFFKADNNPQGLAALDLDHDGKADLAVASRYGFVSILLTTPDPGGPPPSCGAIPPGSLQPITTIASDAYPVGIAVDATDVYWTDWASVSPAGGRIMKRDLALAGPPIELTSGEAGAFGIAVDATHVYWTNNWTDTVKRVLLDGSGEETMATGQSQARVVRLDANNVYWTSSAGIHRLAKSAPGGTYDDLCCNGVTFALDGAFVYGVSSGIVSDALADGTMTTLVPGVGYALGMAVDGTNVYWTIPGLGQVNAYAFAGGATTTIASGEASPEDIASDGTNVYWVDASHTAGAIMRAAVAGGAPVALAWGQRGPSALAVDGTTVYWVNRDDGQVLSTPK